MSKERAQRRAVREAEAAERAASRAAEQARAARARARKDGWRRRLRPVLDLVPSSTGKQTGALARRRRTRMRMILALLLFAQIVVWVVRPDWQARLAAFVIAVFVFPVAAAFAL